MEMSAESRSSEKKPAIYLFYGDDSPAISKTTQELAGKLGDAAMADMNTSRLQGNQARLEELRATAFAMPFLAERRLVIVSQPLDLLKGEKKQSAFIELLEAIPPSTALVLLVETERDRKDWKDFGAKHWLRKWAAAQPPTRVFMREFAQPAARQMGGWIQQEARRQKGQFVPAAAQALAELVGNNTQSAGMEIEKLLTYVNYERAVEIDDVRSLVADVAPVNIFDMVDAMAEGRSQQALQLLHSLLEDADHYGVFGMIVRQFRLLLMAREVLDGGGRKEQIAQVLNIHPFVAEKLEKQAQRFSMPQLEAIYPRLLDIDESMKTSQMEATLALDLFVSELTP